MNDSIIKVDRHRFPQISVSEIGLGGFVAREVIECDQAVSAVNVCYIFAATIPSARSA